MNQKTLTTRLGHLILWAACMAALPAGAQQFLMDKPVKAGELTLFPDLNDAAVYYYVSDKPRLATDAQGRPQFSFLRYVDNIRSGADQPEAREGEGGGIVHALVVLGVTQDQLREAQRDLQRVKAGARIQGPVIYKSGRFGLVSSFKDADGQLTRKVVGLGNAPILDGEKAAVSLHLTKQGAKILWESFNSPTPDISFTFEMEVEGYRSPQRGLIEANFDQVYEHQAFNAGLASTYLAAEIKLAFDDLVRQGAIKVTQVGADEKIDALLTTAYNKLTEMMFSPLGGTGTPSLGSLTEAAGGQNSLLDRATTMLARNRTEAQTENERIRRENREAEDRRSRDAATPAPGAGERSAPSSTNAGPNIPLPARDAGVRPPTRTEDPGLATVVPAGRGSGASTAPRQEVSAPSFAVVAAYEMKRVRQRGEFRIDLNKFTTDKLTLRFDENIGDLSQLKGDQRHFREVNLDDPLFRQREIVVFLDGFNAPDFGQFINFVTVQMRKRHANGDLTDDETRIDRNNFNREGNNFKLLYGWKGDNDRRTWLNYQFRTIWSFFGGQTVELPWQDASSPALNLAAPLQRRVVEIQADPTAIADAQVRSITVKLFYGAAGREGMKQVTLNPARSQLSERVEFLLPANQLEYGYEVTWRLTGSRTVSSGRRNASDAILFVDELPRS